MEPSKYQLINIVILIILAIFSLFGIEQKKVTGGNGKPNNNNIVVDTLNLTYFLKQKVSIDDIIETIKFATPTLKKKYSDRIIFVFKEGRDIKKYTDGDFKQLANELKIIICITSNEYVNKPIDTQDQVNHSSNGMDDLYAILMANLYNCPILTNDKLRDIKQFYNSLNRFHVTEYLFNEREIKKNYINPIAYKKIWKPKLIKLEKYFTKKD